MSDYKEIPPRPENWTLPIKKEKDLGAMWKQFSEDFRSQPTKDVSGRSNSYNPPMEQIDFNNQKPQQ